MINRLASFIQRPEWGWDPVSPAWACTYASAEWDLNGATVDRLEQWVSGFKDKRLLDIGGGPGQYSVAFAKRGARVTWHDVSRNYLAIATKHAEQAQVNVTFSLGYLEDAARLIHDPFDIIFSRCCWYYCMNDRGFADLVYGLLKPGGRGYIDSPSSEEKGVPGYRRLLDLLNRTIGLKVGHPYPPHGRIAHLFNLKPIETLLADYSSPQRDVVMFTKTCTYKQ